MTAATVNTDTRRREKANRVTCAFGTAWTWPHACPACDAYGRGLQRQFVQGVMDGQHDREGYTRAERMKTRRIAAVAPLFTEAI